MKKLVAVFLVAVLGPSLVLAWLAMRSLRDQEIVVHSQRAVLHQRATDALASDMSTFMDDVRVFFGRLVDDLVEEYGPIEMTQSFYDIVPARWGQASFSCVVTDDGSIICPPPDSTDPEIRKFLAANGDFLTNRTRAEVYQAPVPIGNLIIIEESDPPESAPPRHRFEAPASLSEVASSAPAPTTSVASAPDPAGFSGDSSAKQAAAAEGKSAMKKKEVASLYQQQRVQKVAIAQEKLQSTFNRRGNAQLSGQSGGLDLVPQQFGELPLGSGPEAAVPNPSRQVEMREIAAADAGIQAEPEQTDQAAALPAATTARDSRQPAQQWEEQGGYVVSPKTRNVQPFAQVDNGGQYRRLIRTPNDVAGDNPDATPWSTLEVNWGDLRQIMGNDPEGAISRFLEDGLHVLLWKRHPAIPGTVFWAELDLEAIKEDLRGIVHEAAAAAAAANAEPEISLALLDNNNQLVSQTVTGFSADWRRPFVASEVGEILPHWEVAAYLIDPDALNRSANLAQLILRLLVPILLVAIALGAVLIITEMGREMRLARQKTDFVSNVSHELKTPLTSIRMFSDLLSTEKTVEREKRTEYSGIISREAGRLTRLINNLLDFSRMERGEKKYEFEPLNAVSLARETVENYRLQIESDGFGLNFHHSNGSRIPITGDRDSLSQVLLNLLSNAEKYGGDTEAIDVEVAVENRAGGEMAEIRVLDRGPGVPRKHSGKIFEKFFRADDSLSSGIEGSGLGLTLARQIAREHGGDVVYRPREGGGSCFAMTLPVENESAD